MCQINVHAGLFGTFCFSKGKRSFCLSLLKLQNVPNKPACMFIWHIRVIEQRVRVKQNAKIRVFRVYSLRKVTPEK